jgi:hypothetical protein
MPENDVPGEQRQNSFERLNEGRKIGLSLDPGGVYVENRRRGREKLKWAAAGRGYFPKQA